MNDKIVLKDGTAFEIEQSSSSGTFQIAITDVSALAEVIGRMTPDNLSQYQVVNQDGLTVARPQDKECRKCELNFIWANNSVVKIVITVVLSDVDLIAKRLADLEETASILVQESLLGGEV